MDKSFKQAVEELREKATEFNAFKTGIFYITKEEISYGGKFEDETSFSIEAYSEDLNATTLIGLGQIKGWNLSDEKCFNHFVNSI